MKFTSARWADPEHTVITAIRADESVVSIPANIANRDFRTLVEGDEEQTPIAVEEYARCLDTERARDDLNRAIKAEAQRRVLRVAPAWKQRNMLARRLEIQERAAEGALLSKLEIAERDAIRDAWARIKALREASDAKYLEIQSLGADLVALANYDVQASWPE